MADRSGDAAAEWTTDGPLGKSSGRRGAGRADCTYRPARGAPRPAAVAALPRPPPTRRDPRPRPPRARPSSRAPEREDGAQLPQEVTLPHLHASAASQWAQSVLGDPWALPKGPWAPQASRLWKGWGLLGPPPPGLPYPVDSLPASHHLWASSREFESVMTSLNGWGECIINHVTSHMGSAGLWLLWMEWGWS